MKYQIGRTLTSLALAVLLFAGMAHAQFAGQVIKVKVPFEFEVNGHTFPAGTYSLVRTAPHLLVLRDSRAHTLAMVITGSIQAPTAPASAKLDFYTDGDRHVLARVWQEDNNTGQELYRPKPATVLAKRRTVNHQAAAAGSSQP